MRSRPAVTLEHVALAAGVSRATASRVLTGSGVASERARRQVLEAAVQLGYVADPVARALVSGRGTRLVVAASAQCPDDVEHCAYTSRVVSAAAQVCAAEGLGVALRWVPVDSPGAVLDDLARDRSVAGVLLVNTTELTLQLLPRDLAGRVASIGVGGPGVPEVDVDTLTVARRITEHLLTTGRRRVALLAGPAWMPCAQRPVAAYRAAMRAAGLPAHVVPGDFSARHGRAGAAEVLRRWPDTDAVYGICDEVALGALQTLRAAGRQVPGDVAVMGFDDIPAAEFSGPGLTTATHPVEQIATAATRIALGVVPGARTLFPSELVLRETA
ncbi:LacI family DNA-binding transcriptional regulator [Modestobacter versicolor]|uniref:DNA-binding LacI/PurR family transcriptional regulator n=1 Tax=Modestobacter versicolor TaxID=429133 RepID=A0A323VCZ0_9ACTN|nr:LacI family DNA-binding transcriptional regulator [Modestobacter versicolor]MBB3677468.1 DNA-binding LacI/PurR family transcriptional regulator [Modestobacter versicolor]PZA22587.1 LacI family transcriptional regulator [Modestobacter versicolor]